MDYDPERRKAIGFLISGLALGGGGFIWGRSTGTKSVEAQTNCDPQAEQNLRNFLTGYHRYSPAEVDNIARFGTVVPPATATTEGQKAAEAPTTTPTAAAAPEVRATAVNQAKEVKVSDTVNLVGLYETTKRGDEIVNQVNGVLDISPGLERAKAEWKIWENLEKNGMTIGDIVTLTGMCASTAGRCWGIQRMVELAQAGRLAEYGIGPMSSEKLKWAYSEGIDPRALMIAEATYTTAQRLLANGQKYFFEADADFVNQANKTEADFEARMPNPGVVAKLMMSETGTASDTPYEITLGNGSKLDFWSFGLGNVGTEWAWTQVNTARDMFPSAYDDLKGIAQELKRITGANFEESDKRHTLPGSSRTSGNGVVNASGGAIGPQLMPNNARLFMSWWNMTKSETGMAAPQPNILSPIEGTVLVYLYLSAQWFARHPSVLDVTKVVRAGYRRGDTAAMDGALAKWNAYQPEIDGAINAGNSYFDTFLSK